MACRLTHTGDVELRSRNSARPSGATQGRIRAGLIGFLLLMGGGGLFLPRAGRFLVAEDSFSRADVALVLSGLPTSRAFAARDLYRQGRAREIWVIPEPPNKIEGEGVVEPVKEELVRLRLVDPSRPQWAGQILLASGVPREKVVLLPEAANGTPMEAVQVRAFLRRRPAGSLALITSRSASRRARFIFRRILRGANVQVFSSPTPYDAFEADRWWSQPRNALTVVTEYEKLLVNVLTLTFRSPPPS